MKKVLSIILGGGRGTRLFPLTKYRAKPAVPIGGKFRLIDIPISNCIHWGLKKIFILTQFNTVSLHSHIATTYRFDGFSKGFVQILAAQQTIKNNNWYQGTADAVRQNLNYIKNQDVDYVVILSGDQLFRINLREFLDYHKIKNADITIASKPIYKEVAKSFGILKVDKHRKIVDFYEKPKDDNVLNKLYNPSDYIDKDNNMNFIASMGIYIFNKDVLIELLENNEKEDFGKQIIPDSIKTHNVYSYIFRGYWEDIGTIGAFFEANLDFANPVPKFNFYNEIYPIFTHARFLPGSKVKNCEINHALISDGSILEWTKIFNSIIGIRSIIREGTSLERVIMMGADCYEDENSIEKVKIGIGKHCSIKNAILDKNVSIGDNVVIDYKGNSKKEDNGFYYIVDGIVVIPKGVLIPDNTKIE
jgi:glucose-1-phosphate adenylyltransferase